MSAVGSRRGVFDGVRQIFVFNWHFYVATLAVDGFAIWLRSAGWAAYAVDLIAALATFWAVSSLLVSHYVYDRSPLCRWEWLADVVSGGGGSWANILFDQTTPTLERLFPCALPRSLDIYSPSEMSEPSIERARRHAVAVPEHEKANASALPLADRECDTIFVIVAAHELRSHRARVRFFREIGRALALGGRLVLVEHLRNWHNVLAYGPGAWHFFSEREWRVVAREAGLQVIRQRNMTPFVCCFVLGA